MSISRIGLSDERNTIIFVSYQIEGTMGKTGAERGKRSDDDG